MEASLASKCYRIVRDEDEEDLGSPSSDSSSASSSTDFMDDATSSSSSSSPSSSSDQLSESKSPLFEMSDLMSELPVRRGLSNHYHGKSQSFTSLSNASCLEDLAKPQVVRGLRRKRMKPCKSYGGGMDGHKPLSPKGYCNKKTARGSSFLLLPSSFVTKRGAAGHGGVFGARPPVHPHSSGNLSGQALLFA